MKLSLVAVLTIFYGLGCTADSDGILGDAGSMEGVAMADVADVGQTEVPEGDDGGRETGPSDLDGESDVVTADDHAEDSAIDACESDGLEDSGVGDTEFVEALDADDVMEPTDITEDTAEIVCQESPAFDYRCQMGVEETCPGGLCVLSMCLGPELDPERWSACGDLVCDPCLQPCEVDCGPVPPVPQIPDHSGADTMVVYVHGFEFYTDDDIDKMEYGQEGGCGMSSLMKVFGVDRPCGNSGSTDPNQMTSLEYYGHVPADWLTPGDVMEIENYPVDGVDSLTRYSIITAKFIRHKMSATGATKVNLICHSMGCLILRNMIEHDIGELASEGTFPRWFTVAGALAGAREANYADNPYVLEIMDALSISYADFVVLQPEIIRDAVVTWDHTIDEGNHPFYAPIIIHHLVSSDPAVDSTMGIPTLNFLEPGDVPNDGVLYSPDMYFHAQAESARYWIPTGDRLASSHSFLHQHHNMIKKSDNVGLLATAALFHGRRVEIRLESVRVLSDRESKTALDGEHGQVPAEIGPEVEVRYNPYVMDTWGLDLIVAEQKLEHRTVETFQQAEGVTMYPNRLLFDGPVLDQMTDLAMTLNLLEVDSYPYENISEYVLKASESMLTWSGAVPLSNHAFEIESEYVKAKVRVRVYDLF